MLDDLIEPVFSTAKLPMFYQLHFLESAMTDTILGYLNFGSNLNEPQFYFAVNQLFLALANHHQTLPVHDEDGSDSTASAAELADLPSNRVGQSLAIEKNPRIPQNPMKSPPVYREFFEALRKRLLQLKVNNETFRNIEQALSVLEITESQVLPGYLRHHEDLLEHQSEATLFNSFFVARVLAAVVENQGAEPVGELVDRVIQQLNCYLGHRPLANLESWKVEPYPHERVAPIPLYLSEVGAAEGPYRELIEGAMEVIAKVDPDILRSAEFDPRRLSEVCMDPRAYDFDHPINRRPNHHFGQWDEDWIDNEGFYRRFIVHQVILDAILARTQEQRTVDDRELLREGSICLAGTILMGSGISGAGPSAHDSNMTLQDLVVIISAYRDQFYVDALKQLPPAHRQRLEQEAQVRRQPFGASRQDLNSRLNQAKARQLVNSRLAMIYARMGYADAAQSQTRIVPVASTRMLCQIDCLLDKAIRAVAENQLEDGLRELPAIMDRLNRGIECGAIVDPWNILGFDGNYSLFPALENSVTDHRVFELVELMENIFALCSRIWSEAAANDQQDLCQEISGQFSKIVDWWRKFAAHQVSSVGAVDAQEVFDAAQLVAQALMLWQKGGAAAGDIEFWAEHAEMFDSPKAYSLVIDALMQRGDYATSTALLIHWLSESEEIPLQMADTSFYQQVHQWIARQRASFMQEHSQSPDRHPLSWQQFWKNIRKFHDFIEANAGEYWDVPEFSPALDQGRRNLDRSPEIEEEELDEIISEFDAESDDSVDMEIFRNMIEQMQEEAEDDEEDLFRHAYDDVTYQDTTDDGFEGEIYEGHSSFSDAELEEEIDWLLDRLEFISMLADYWTEAALIPLPVTQKADLDDQMRLRIAKRGEIYDQWLVFSERNSTQLKELLSSIDSQFPMPRTGSDYESLVQYERYLEYKETLLDQAIQTTIDVENAHRMLLAARRAIEFLLSDQPLSGMEAEPSAMEPVSKKKPGSEPLVAIFAAVLLKDTGQVEQHFDQFLEYLQNQPLLYIPISKGGAPAAMVRTRALQLSLLDLIRMLPALGMLARTYDLIANILSLERKISFSSGAVTEFDEIFEVGFISMLNALIEASDRESGVQHSQEALAESASNPGNDSQEKDRLFDCVEKLTESMLMLWLKHSQTLRLSVLEKVQTKAAWGPLEDFVKKYGGGLFTQQFFHYSNIRAILHQGVEQWLQHLQDSPARPDLRLLDELGTAISRNQAVAHLTLVLEAVLENYNEYADYNSTTTQSDDGACLYMFLDFLRLRSRYDRICWHLKPIIWAHNILISRQKNAVANLWRRSLTSRLNVEANRYLKNLETLRERYSMRMESIGRRIEGRFSDQMQIDRLCALVPSAMEDPHNDDCQLSFRMLQKQAEIFVDSTQVVGINLPGWLAALENQVEQYQLLEKSPEKQNSEPVPVCQLDLDSLETQLNALPRGSLFEK
jgi:hypothetical protein